MQRRIAGDVSPEAGWSRQRRIQDELPADRLSEYNPAIGPGPVAGFNDRKQFAAQETLKIFGTSSIVALIRRRGVIGAAVIPVCRVVAPVRDSDDNCIRHFLPEIQVSVVG